MIAAKAKAPLAADDLDRLRSSLDRAGLSAGEPDWLSPDEAVDVPFEGDPQSGLAAARDALSGSPFDVNALPVARRRKRLLVADMDSTMIQQECIDELAATIGIGDAVAAITERAMRGEIAFEPALIERVNLLADLPLATVESLLADRISLMPGARTLVATMRAHGAYAALVSGGFTSFAGPIAARLGFDEHRANRLLVDGDRFTGRVQEPILGSKAKEEALLELTEKLGLDRSETLAVGDGANDLPMVRIAGLGVAYRAKPALREAAGAVLDHADLTGLLFLQGYRRDEFTS